MLLMVMPLLKQCEVYIGKLKAANKLIAAQPIIREGCTITKTGDEWNIDPVDATKQIQVGYYHIIADDIDDAIAIAKENPEFAYVSSASIEVRPVKMKEEQTNFVYPK
jgi:hypothetical protein